ncbi:hypothetical protein FNV43_RR25992 [Rhamnella rubrinervis]|uniref:protein-disulfide reductase n=1 Tax=Rhamnella rubrinervis TaxID=2594499 RepID=A0A8K0GJ80_9ROSA|nr:hypothetical protein FNV43_RR25992 [Rhamnella rubrinervis]
MTNRKLELQRDTMAESEEIHDLSRLLSSNERDFLIQNYEQQIPVSSLVGKTVGLYFCGASWEPCTVFTEKLVKVYEKLGSAFEVVHIPSKDSETKLLDGNEEIFKNYYPKLPWLMIPYCDSESIKRLEELFMFFRALPKLFILDSNGKVITSEGVKLVMEYGEHAFPFTSDHIRILEETEARKWQCLNSIFGPDDLLIAKENNQVPVNSLAGKIVGLYFAASSHCECQRFTPLLVKFYQEIGSTNFEVIYISSEESRYSIREYYTTMPWLSIRFSDSETRKSLKEIFKIVRISEVTRETRVPKLVIFDAEGKLTTDEGKEIVLEYGIDGYPFTSEKISTLKQNKQNQTLSSIFAPSDFFISNTGEKVPVSAVENNIVCLYFRKQSECQRFDRLLLETHTELTTSKMGFEVVVIQDQSETESLPFLTLSDYNTSESLAVHFKIQTFPGLVLIGPNGKTLVPDAVDLIRLHGSRAYPFTPVKIAELERQLRKQQTLKFLLCSEDRDFLIGPNGSIKNLSELEGKHVQLFFSAKYTKSSGDFVRRLIKPYEELGFEVVYISCDINRQSFNEYYEKMPWLALPFGDEKQKFLLRWFGITELPQVVELGKTGRTITTAGVPFLINREVEEVLDDNQMMNPEDNEVPDDNQMMNPEDDEVPDDNQMMNPEDEVVLDDNQMMNPEDEEVLDDNQPNNDEGRTDTTAGLDRLRHLLMLEEEEENEEDEDMLVFHPLEDHQNNNEGQIGLGLLFMIHVLNFYDRIVLLIMHVLAIFLDFFSDNRD